MEHEPAFPLSKNPWIFFYTGDATESTFPEEDVKVRLTLTPRVLAAELLHSRHPGSPLGVTVPNTPNCAHGPGCHQVTHGWRQIHGHQRAMAVMSLRRVKMMLTWKP